jgi:hypothetical protein
MKKFLLGVLLLPALTTAEPVNVDKTVVCDRATTMLSLIEKKYQEKPIWFANSKDGDFVVTINRDTNTWSIIQFSLEKNIACLIDSGIGFKFKLPGLGV